MSLVALPATAQEKKPNILVIWGDDIGWFNISAYNMGKMGYRTPNIDRIAREGVPARVVTVTTCHLCFLPTGRLRYAVGALECPDVHR